MVRLGGVWLVSIVSLTAVGCGSSDASNVTEDGGGGDGGDGGAAGTGGSGGAAGAGGGSGAAGTGDCIDFSHAEGGWGPPRDLRVVGADLQAYEGETVRLVITIGEPRYGLAETAIKNGAFELTLPGAVGNYTGMGAYIDKGKDNACTLGVDASWEMTTGGDHGDVTWNITPSSPPPAGHSPCNINGIFDMTRLLACPR
jgi:hypothetical protein